jgi:hypothetical protein
MILQNKLRYLNILIVKIIKYFFQIIINFYIKENQKFFLQKMEFGLTEVILGYRVDELVRLIVVLGSGGVLAEILDDNSVRIAPVELSDAMEMIEEVKALSIINGYRGMPKGDLFSLAKAIESMSQLSFNKKIKEA